MIQVSKLEIANHKLMRSSLGVTHFTCFRHALFVRNFFFQFYGPNFKSMGPATSLDAEGLCYTFACDGFTSSASTKLWKVKRKTHAVHTVVLHFVPASSMEGDKWFLDVL